MAASASARPSRRVPRPWAIVRPAAAAALERRHGRVDQVPGRDAARDEIVGDRDEQLRLVGIERERDDPRAEHAR